MNFRYFGSNSQILLKSRVNTMGRNGGVSEIAKTSAIVVSLACLIEKSYDFVVYWVVQGFFSGRNPPQNKVRHRR
jgi:hypothetical protein